MRRQEFKHPASVSRMKCFDLSLEIEYLQAEESATKYYVYSSSKYNK